MTAAQKRKLELKRHLKKVHRRAERELKGPQPEAIIAAGKALREAREARGMSIEMIKEASGIGEGQISRIENGLNNPTLGSIVRMAEAMNCRVEVLVVRKKNNREAKNTTEG